jgi:hypothetical protein
MAQIKAIVPMCTIYAFVTTGTMATIVAMVPVIYSFKMLNIRILCLVRLQV